jgi:hypothetical protein
MHTYTHSRSGSHASREIPTLQLMWDHCRGAGKENEWVFYLHAKGVGHRWPKFKWTQGTLCMCVSVFVCVRVVFSNDNHKCVDNDVYVPVHM